MKVISIFSLFIIFLTTLNADPLYRNDDASRISIDKQVPGSHIKVYIPTMPYLYLSKLINGTLVRSSDNDQGWEFMLATALKREGNLVYIFTLREGVRFQDGSLFNADSVINNFNSFLNKSKKYVLLRERLQSVEKLSSYKVKFTFHEPFELFLDKLTRINIYTPEYLKKYEWGTQNKQTADNMMNPGPYGLGPYILKEGYATGLRQTPIIKLKANPYYYEKGLPYIENITVFTELNTETMLDMALKNEAKLDIAPIPFDQKVETLTSPYSKLISIPSNHTISVLFNMLRPNSKLKNHKIRLALNQAINQEKLLKFVYRDEGDIAPLSVNKNFAYIEDLIKDIPTYQQKLWKENPNPEEHLRNILSGLELNVVTMDRHMFLWKGIEFQLGQYGVKINYTIIHNEIALLKELFSNKTTPKEWDILTWGNDSWTNSNVWSALFHFSFSEYWTTMDYEATVDQYILNYKRYQFGSQQYLDNLEELINYLYEKAFMLAVPSPNIVLAVNKEVDYTPVPILLMPLWKTKLTPYHWSIRKGPYPKSRKISIDPQGLSNDTIIKN